jgi:hypothetical protein
MPSSSLKPCQAPDNSIRLRVAEIVGYISVGISALCLIVTPVFSPAIVAAAAIGMLGGAVTFVLGIRRLALVAVAFPLAPLVGLLVIEFVYKQASSGYLVIAPLATVVVLAICGDRLLKVGRGRPSGGGCSP